LDILVTFREPNDIDLFKFIELRLFLKDKLGIDVDLVEKDTIKPRIKAWIFEEAVKI
jgi:predicted nucleotidyltransferase